MAKDVNIIARDGRSGVRLLSERFYEIADRLLNDRVTFEVQYEDDYVVLILPNEADRQNLEVIVAEFD